MEIGPDGWPVVRREDSRSEPPSRRAKPSSMPAGMAGNGEPTNGPLDLSKLEPVSLPLLSSSPTAGATGDPEAPDSPLNEVFRAVGSRFELNGVEALRASGRILMQDGSGRLVGERFFVHEFAVSGPVRDRLAYDVGSGFETVYGRDGHVVFAQRKLSESTVPLPRMVPEAQSELDILGLLARVPWCFADRERYRVGPLQRLTIGGRQVQRLVFERRAAPRGEGPPRVDRFELDCIGGARGLQPVELRYTLAHSDGVPRRVRLSNYYPIAGLPVSIPQRREVLDASGRPALVIEFTDVGQLSASWKPRR